MSDDIKMNELKIENHGVIPKEEEHTTPENKKISSFSR